MIVSRLEQHPTLTPLLGNILKSTMHAGDSVRVFTPIANAVVSLILKRPANRGNNSEAASRVYDQISRREGLVERVGSKLGIGWSHEAIQNLLDKSQAEVTQTALARNASTKVMFDSYQSLLAHLKKELNLVEVVPVSGESRATPPIEAILKVGESLGPVGVRFLQVIGQYIDLPSEYEDRFRDVYDSMEGQSKYTAFAIIERLAQTDEATRKFLNEELVSVDEKIGGGSIMTTFKITTRDEFGQFQHEVLKVKNPNAERFVIETITQARLVIQDLKKTNPGQKLNYEIAERLLSTIEDWVLGDIRDEEFLNNDRIFSTLHDGYQTKDGVTVRIAGARQPNNIFLKRETYVEGVTINKRLGSNLTAEQLSNVQRYAAATVEGFVRQLTIPAYSENSGKLVYLVLSDIHPGNVIISSNQDTIYPIDRNYYLKLSQEDVNFIKVAIRNDPPKEKLGTMVRYFLNLKENAALGLESDQVAQQIFQTLARGQIFDTLAGRRQETSLRLMAKFLHELDTRGVKVPLRIRIVMKNIDAVNKMMQQTKLDSFPAYLKT